MIPKGYTTVVREESLPVPTTGGKVGLGSVTTSLKLFSRILHTGEMTRTANLPVLPADWEDFIGKVLVLLDPYSEAPSRHPLQFHWA